MRILFITATRIGDAVLSTGVLDHLHRQYPQARFTVACGPAAAGIFARMPRLDQMIVVDKRRFDGHWFDLWRRTVTAVWDLVVDLRGSALSFLLPARRRMVMRGGRRQGHRLGHLAQVVGLGAGGLAPAPVVWTNAADRARAEMLIPGGVPAGVPVIALGPTANWEGKVWPSEQFVALVKSLTQTRLPGALVAVFAGPGAEERRLAEPVLNALPGAIDLVGQLTLAEAAACLARCTLFIGNDSGLMHLSAAAGTPTLGLFGPSMAAEYAPTGRHTGIAVAPGPAGRAPIAGLPVESALREAVALLDRVVEAQAA